MNDDDGIATNACDALHEIASAPPEFKIVPVSHVTNHDVIKRELAAHAAKHISVITSNTGIAKETYALTKTNAISASFAALTAPFWSLDKDVLIVAVFPM